MENQLALLAGDLEEDQLTSLAGASVTCSKLASARAPRLRTPIATAARYANWSPVLRKQKKKDHRLVILFLW
jgi:hypothetical protein